MCYTKIILVFPHKFPATQLSIYQAISRYRIEYLCRGFGNLKVSNGVYRYINPRLHLLSMLYSAFLDHVGEIAWYLRLVQHVTQGRKKLRIILARVSSINLLLLGAAIFNALSNIGIIELGLPFLFVRYYVMGLLTQFRSSLSFALCRPSPLSSENGYRNFVKCRSHNIAIHRPISIVQPSCQGTGRRGERRVCLEEPSSLVLAFIYPRSIWETIA